MNSTTKHEYDLRTRTYHQPDFYFQTLQRMQTVNKAALNALQTSKKHAFEKREVPVGTNLFDLIGFALKEPALSPVIFEALMSELEVQTKSVISL
jgi:small subunit ribosomal protein S29